MKSKQIITDLAHNFSLKMKSISVFLLVIPLVLSAFTHIWNPIGFPSIHIDEGTYMRRAMNVLESQGAQEPKPTIGRNYDHPFFGQLFLAAALKIIGYPYSLLHPSTTTTTTNTSEEAVHSIEMLYLVPRVLMGLLAVVDTFLIYKIAEVRYNNNRKVAFIASILFAVMPVSWFTRRIYLDSIQLPFILLSILFAMYYAKKRKNNNKSSSSSFLHNTLQIILMTGEKA